MTQQDLIKRLYLYISKLTNKTVYLKSIRAKIAWYNSSLRELINNNIIDYINKKQKIQPTTKPIISGTPTPANLNGLPTIIHPAILATTMRYTTTSRTPKRHISSISRKSSSNSGRFK